MKIVRRVVILMFIISCILFSVRTIKSVLTEDRNPPVISFESEELSLTMDAGDEALLEGVIAKDKESGDLTDRIQIASRSKIMSGKRIITYIVFDDANQLGTAQRVIRYSDYKPPRFSLKEPLRFTPSEFSLMSETLGVTAYDGIDGDLTDDIRITYQGAISDMEGVYPVTIQVSNSAGDTSSFSTVVLVINPEDPEEMQRFYPVLSDYIVYTSVGNNLDLKSYLLGIKSQSEQYMFGTAATPANINASKVAVESNVDYETPGVYTVTYSYTTRNGVVGSTPIYIVVEE